MGDHHVVFGTGAIGSALIEELGGAGVPVRAVNRSGTIDLPDDVQPDRIEIVAGDAADPVFAAAAARDAAAVYQCLNPPYHRWAEEFPGLQDSVVAAAQATQARYVSFENTYMYGDTGGQPMTEDTPTNAHTRKGRVRRAMAERLAQLHAAGDLDVATARASDYFGPRGVEQSPLGERMIGRALTGASAQVIGDPDQPHSYTFTRDAARTMLALGTRDDVSGEVFHVPNAPAVSTREIVAMIGEHLGREVKVSPAPRLVLKLMGLFDRTVRELDEMLYEFTQPFVVDGTKAERRLGVRPTPMDEALAETIAWFRARG